MQKITFELSETDGVVHGIVVVSPPITFDNRCKLEIERVGQAMSDAAFAFDVKLTEKP
jgi:hypothetical protein